MIQGQFSISGWHGRISTRTSLYSGEAHVCLGGHIRPVRGRSKAEKRHETRAPLSGDPAGVGGVAGEDYPLEGVGAHAVAPRGRLSPVSPTHCSLMRKRR